MDIVIFIIFVVAFILSVILHEIAHGYAANYFGDDTAKMSGRLSFNPLVHIDLFGSILVPFLLYMSQTGFLFGWAKPVPVNPYRLKGGAKAYRVVTMAGIATNLFLAVASALVLKIVTQFLDLNVNSLGIIFFTSLMQVNIVLAVFNTLPFPGFDGFNFLNTFRPVADLIKKTPLANPLFMARYGLMISILLIFLFMGLISQIFFFIFNLFLKIFGL